VWQYLRALGFVKNAGGHRVFLRDTLASLALSENTQRVLISGSADDAMTLIVLEAFRGARVPPEVTVVDRCETPLALSRWSGAKAGVSVGTRRIDILEFAPESSYDIITTTSFLSYFEPAVRPRLFARWASLLRPGGKLLFTNRLRPTVAADAQCGFTPDEAQAFSAAVRCQAELHRNVLGLDPEVLEGLVRNYAARIRTFPVRSVDEVLALLDEAGFVADRIDTAELSGTSAGAAIAGPTAAGRAEFVRVVATRT
jgi:SAM-dependent methyltransferase